MKRIDMILQAKDIEDAVLQILNITCEQCGVGLNDCESNCYDMGRKYLNEDVSLDEYNIELKENNKSKGDNEMIKIRKDLNVNMDYVATDMVKYAGKESKVLSTGTFEGCKLYKLDVDNGFHCWYEWMFEPIEKENNNVNHPSHYTDSKIEVMDYIEDKQLNFARGNVIKYVSRAGKKDPTKEIEDLSKAAWYLNREIERLKGLNS